MFKSTIVTLLTLAMAFRAMAAPLPVPVAGVVAERDTIEIKPRVNAISFD